MSLKCCFLLLFVFQLYISVSGHVSYCSNSCGGSEYCIISMEEQDDESSLLVEADDSFNFVSSDEEVEH